MILQELEKKKLIHPPSFPSSNCMYLTIMGSVSYGVSSDTLDMDIYGFCIPRREMVFPHLAGHIFDFDETERFHQWQQHHVYDHDALGGKGREYDFTVFSIVRYFRLLLDGNPNLQDSIWTPQTCVLHCTQVGNMVRENRTIFLSKACFSKLKSYAFSQLHKMENKNNNKVLRRIMDFEKDNGIPHTITLVLYIMMFTQIRIHTPSG